jgi:hypothetical protein
MTSWLGVKKWSFQMLKDAALLTLEIATEALEKNMILKDASAYNVQLHKGRMVFIDSLSFETYDESRHWIAYKQFCEHFFAPALEIQIQSAYLFKHPPAFISQFKACN